MRRWCRLVVGAAAVALAACSLDSSGSTDAPDGGAVSSSGAGAAAGSPGGGATATSATGSGAGGASSTSASTSSSAGGGGSSASSTGSSGGGGGSNPQCTDPGGVCCGGAYCDLASSSCCATQIAMAGQCVAASQQCAPDQTQMVCDDSGDCPNGEFCCATWNGAIYTALSCKAPCDSPGPGPTPGDYVQCIVGTLCPSGQPCNADTSHFGPPHGYCNPP